MSVKSICKNCEYYQAYYKRQACGYSNQGFGECSVNKESVKSRETCLKYKINTNKLKRQDVLLIEALENASKSIIEIVDIIKKHGNYLS